MATLKRMFIDLNSFFASVEQNENPNLRGCPTIVVPMNTDYTCAIAASYEAKAYGVKTGTMVREAKRLCPNLHIVEADHKKYVHYHHRVRQVLEDHLPVDHAHSIDEFSCKLIGRERTPEFAGRLARAFKADLITRLGPAIKCSIGFAPNVFLAKVATDVQKPDGLVMIDMNDMPGALSKLKLIDLPGIGENNLRRLNSVGIRTIPDLYQAPPKLIRRIWGSIEGERFWYNLHGAELEPLQTNRSMIGHSRVLPPSLRGKKEAYDVSRALTVKAARRLRREGYGAGLLTLSIRLDDHRRWEGSAPLPGTSDDLTILQTLEGLWRPVLNHTPDLARIKKIAMTFTHLRPLKSPEEDFFPLISKNIMDKRIKLTAAVDRLVDKYHDTGIVRYGEGMPKDDLHDFGTKIAFSRIPDMAEFRE